MLRDSGTLVYTSAGVRDVSKDRLLTVLEGTWPGSSARRRRPSPPRTRTSWRSRSPGPSCAGGFLSAGQKRSILTAAVEWVRVARTGRAQAAVEAIRLRIPTDPAPAPSRGPRRAAWRAWGGGLEIRL